MKLILLIDDDESIRLTFGESLRDQGYRVLEADSGDSGLELARQQMPDLILTDVDMPGGDGKTLLQKIRGDSELGGTQVVLMTGRPDLIHPREGMEQGADDFLLKPVASEELFACIRARLSRADIHWRVEDKVLSEFRASMTSQLPHEFITPLAGILGLSEILMQDAAMLTETEKHDFHSDIYQSALRLQRTIKNYLLMLELDREEKLPAESQGQRPLSRTQLKSSLTAGVDAAVARHGRKADITLEVEDCMVQVRSSDLSHIVEELVDNALKFSRPGSPIEIRFESDGILLVTDSGRGMSSGEIEHIGAFRQFDRKKSEQQGLGVGLVLVQRLVDRNAATFSITSRPDQGIQDKVRFQLARAQVQPGSPST
jgi:two-component system sensor histidine kinase/response regulator